MKRQVRFEQWFNWVDERLDRWQRRIADRLNERVARMSVREQYAWFMGVCLVIAIVCACIILHVFK